MADEDVFKVPGAHNLVPHAVTKSTPAIDWMQADADDLFADLPYCEEPNHQLLSAEFNSLKHRADSTSSPACTRTTSSIGTVSVCSINDSGFETDFSVLSRLSSEGTHDLTSFSHQDPTEDSFLAAPRSASPVLPLDFPKLDLLAEFTRTHHDSDSAYGDTSSLSSASHSQSDCRMSDTTSEFPISQVSNTIKPDYQDTHEGSPKADSACFAALEDLQLGASSSGCSLRRSLNSDLEDEIRAVVAKFSPREPDRLIGRKMGLEQIDIVAELDSRNISGLSVVFTFLDEVDLCRMCQVSRHWKSAVESDPNARRRRVKYLDSRRKDPNLHKENMTVSFSPIPAPRKNSRCLTDATGPLAKVQHAITIRPKKSTLPRPQPADRHDQFLEAAQGLKHDECLSKCPKCSSPAKIHRVQERGWCSRERCKFDFCVKCKNTFHGSQDCSTGLVKKTRTDSGLVGGKKSKKNLRRL